MGRITASKGIAVLFKEFARLSKYELLVVGDGDLLRTLQDRYAGHRHIRFLGSLPQHRLAPLYQKAIALILPSLAPEVFPLTVLEAFAYGTPAIVHNAGGSREAVDRTGGGLVYESQKELRDALAQVAKDSQFRENLGVRARAGYTRFYSQDMYVEGYLTIIRSLTQKKRTSPPFKYSI